MNWYDYLILVVVVSGLLWMLNLIKRIQKILADVCEELARLSEKEGGGQ